MEEPFNFNERDHTVTLHPILTPVGMFLRLGEPVFGSDFLGRRRHGKGGVKAGRGEDGGGVQERNADVDSIGEARTRWPGHGCRRLGRYLCRW
jgi:hypothetical protein